MRRESRRADGTALEEMLAAGCRSAAPAEEIAIGNLEAAQPQAAIDSLPAEERQVLALHYFEEVDQRHAAELLYMSERTFRRRLRRTLSDLARLLGAPAPEPGSHRGLEIGLAAWAGLGGGRVVAHTGIVGHLGALLTSLPKAPGRLLDRLRGPGTRLVASEAPERFGAVAGGPAGKVIGGCAGAAVVCALSGVVGPGLDLGAGGDPGTSPTHHHPTTAARHPAATHPIIVDGAWSRGDGKSVQPASDAGASEASSSTPAPRRSAGNVKTHKKVTQEPKPSESEVTEEQFSGISRAAAESEYEAPGSEVEDTSVEQASPASAAPSSAPTKSTGEERQVEEQFRGPLAR